MLEADIVGKILHSIRQFMVCGLYCLYYKDPQEGNCAFHNNKVEFPMICELRKKDREDYKTLQHSYQKA